MSRRIERLNEQVKREITEILRSEVRDPRIGLITVTDVRVAPDLSFARVYVRSMGDDTEQEEAMAGLAAAGPFIKHALSQRLTIRTVPSLRFEADRALEYGMHIEKLLGEIKKTEAEE